MLGELSRSLGACPKERHTKISSIHGKVNMSDDGRDTVDTFTLIKDSAMAIEDLRHRLDMLAGPYRIGQDTCNKMADDILNKLAGETEGLPNVTLVALMMATKALVALDIELRGYYSARGYVAAGRQLAYELIEIGAGAWETINPRKIN
jgi:hypothetical protein